MPRVVLAMSGGVDSSASAVLLRRQGYDVVGLFMRTGAHADAADGRADRKKGCCSAIDAGDARRVADKLDIPFYALDFEREFDRIIDYFADEYARGRTPNPCVVCNTWLKFGRLAEFADQIGADFIATGHYARIAHGPDGAELHKGIDPHKDQSYVLHGVARGVLERLVFPLGDRTKAEARAVAREAGLGVAEKPDSVEICFVPGGDHAEVVRRRRPATRGHGGGEGRHRPRRPRRHRPLHRRPAEGPRRGGGKQAASSWRSSPKRARSWSATATTCGPTGSWRRA